MNMNSKQVLLAGALAACTLAANGQSVSYKVIVNDPDDYKRTQLYLDLFTADSYLGAALGSAAKLETMVGERIMPWAQLKYSWADANTHHVVSGYPTSAGGLKKQEVIEFGSALFFRAKNVKKTTKVTLASSDNGRTRSHTYINIPSMVKKMLGVEGGINISRRALVFDSKSHTNYRYKSTDGTIDQPIGEAGDNSTTQPAGEYYQPLSMSHVFSLFGGIHFRRINNISLSTGEYGHKSNRKVTDLYVDAMLAPSVKVDNVIDIAGKEWVLAPQGSNAKRNLGWRAGATYHNGQKVGLEYNFEFGQKPGPIMGDGFLNNGTYVSLGFGLNIGFDKHVPLGGHGKDKKKDAPDTKS
jgi:hypothetical protein